MGDMIDLGSLKPMASNPRKIATDALKRLAGSIKRDPQFMELRPIVVDEDRTILGGNQRFRACQHLGMKELPASWVRTAAGLTDEQRRRFVLVDNAPEGMAGEWDLEILAAQWQMPELGDLGFDMAMLADSLPTKEDDAEPQVDKAEELGKEWGVLAGQIWELGEHRLLCGDSTKPEDVARVMGPDLADMMWTDPPYNVAYVGKTKSKLTIQNDSMADAAFRAFLVDAFSSASAVMREGACFYIAHADSEGFNFRGAVRDVEWKLTQCLIWVKDQFVMGRQDYHWRHEPILYGWKEGAAHHALEDRTQDTVWEHARPRKSEEHPTMKPVDLVARAIRNSSKHGGIVLDLFLGSGTTLIACEQLGRKCRAIELSPGYVAVTLQRFKDATGKTPTLVEGG